MPVLLVRHAHALARSEWDGDDRDRQLSHKGHRQARALAAVITEFKPSRLLSSPYRRCLETVRPVGRALGLPVEREDRLAEGAGRAAVDLVRFLRAEDVALCTHGDVIPDILAALAHEDRVDLGVNPRVEKASVWVLEADGDRFRTARYLPPPDLSDLSGPSGPSGAGTG